MENILGWGSIIGSIAGISYLALSAMSAAATVIGATAFLPVGLIVGTIFAVGGSR
jgi:hypothetical protein